MNLAGPRRQRAARQRLVWLGKQPAGAVAARARGGVLRVGLCGRIGVDVLLEEPGDHVLSEQAGAVLALSEGDQSVLLGLVEHPVEGLTGALEELITQLLTLLRIHRRASGVR